MKLSPEYRTNEGRKIITYNDCDGNTYLKIIDVFGIATAYTLNGDLCGRWETTKEEREEYDAATPYNEQNDSKEAETMKHYYKVSFEYSEGIYCTNMAHAESAADVEAHYGKYSWHSVREAAPYELDEAKAKGMPIIEVEPAQEAQEAQEAAEQAEQTDTTTGTQNAQNSPEKAEEKKEERNMLETMKKELTERKARSAWDKGVTVYALELLDELAEAIAGGYFDAEDIAAPKLLERQLLNGASNWEQYSWGGCSLIYDGDIAERLCTPSELKKTRNGERRPNSREEWLDTQARALFHAARRIHNAARKATQRTA